MITLAEYIDAVGAERRIPRVTLSPDGMVHAERYVREFGEELAEAAINYAIHVCRLSGQNPFDGAHMSKTRKQRLQCALGDPKPLIDPPPDKPSSYK